MAIIITQVKSKSDLKRFVKFPLWLFKDNPYFVPPILKDEMQLLGSENPAMAFCDVIYFLAEKDGKVVGRIAGINNKQENETEKVPKLRIGWFDFMDDFEISRSLFNAILDWAKSRGLQRIEGPVGFTNLDRAGLLTEGFEELSNMVTIYNAPYYLQHYASLGLEVIKPWVEYEFKVPQSIPQRLTKMRKVIESRYGVKVLNVSNKKQLHALIDPFFHLLELSYENNYDFVPFSEEQKMFYAKKFLQLLPPEFVSIVRNTAGELVAFGITAPSLVDGLKKAQGKLLPFGWWHLYHSIKHTKRGELLLIGVHPDWRNKGLIALIFPQVIQNFINKGIEIVESNPELEDNANVRALWKEYDGRLHKKRAIYEKKL